MTHTIHISDEAFAARAATAASTGRTHESVIEEWATQLAHDLDQAWFCTPEWQAGVSWHAFTSASPGGGVTSPTNTAVVWSTTLM